MIIPIASTDGLRSERRIKNFKIFITVQLFQANNEYQHIEE